MELIEISGTSEAVDDSEQNDEDGAITALDAMPMSALEENVESDPIGVNVLASDETETTQVQPVSRGILARIPAEGWYVVLDGGQVGPISRGTLLTHIAEGEVGSDTYVWREGFVEWKVVGDVDGLRESVAAGGLFEEEEEPAEEVLPTLDDLKRTQVVSADVLEAASAYAAQAKADREKGEEVERASPEEHLHSLFGEESPEVAGDGGFFDTLGAEEEAVDDLLYQRRDSSVLFSLGDLGSSGKSAPGVGDGLGERTVESGLIDIRAVARNRVQDKDEEEAGALFSGLEGGLATKVIATTMDTRVVGGTDPLLRVKRRNPTLPLALGIGVGAALAAATIVVIVGNPFGDSEPQKRVEREESKPKSLSQKETALIGSEEIAPGSNMEDPASTDETAFVEAPTGEAAEETVTDVPPSSDGEAGTAEETQPVVGAGPASTETVASGEAPGSSTTASVDADEQRKAAARLKKKREKEKREAKKKREKKEKRDKDRKAAKSAASSSVAEEKTTPTAAPVVKEKKEKPAKVSSSSSSSRRDAATDLLDSLKSGGGKTVQKDSGQTAKADAKPKTLPSSAVRKVIKKHQKKVKSCYSGDGSTTDDKVVATARLNVRGSGSVSSVSVSGNVSGGVKACIKSVLKGVKFPSFQADSQTIPLHFRLK